MQCARARAHIESAAPVNADTRSKYGTQTATTTASPITVNRVNTRPPPRATRDHVVGRTATSSVVHT